MPLLATLLSVPLEDRYPAPTLSPQQERQQTLDTLVAWLMEASEKQPVLAMWEDLHWADPSTLEMLGLVLKQTPTVPMLQVLTYRPEFEPSWPTRSHITPITLNRLERLQVEALIRHLAGGKTLPEDVVQHIVAKTDGVPLYVEELTKMLLASDLLREEAEQYVLTEPLVTVTIPDTLQDSLMARLDQMHTAKEVAQLGAVLGREFSYEMLQAIASQDAETVQGNLAQLVDAELLYQRGRPPHARYIFKHALIQDTAYESLLRSKRQQVHRQIGELLEVRFPEAVEAQPELMAHHYTEAGLNDEAVSYWLRAGQRAIQHSAHTEAIVHLRQGLSLLTALPQTPERRQQELALQVALGPVLRNTEGNAAPGVERAYTRARELCEQIGDTPQLVPVLRGLSLYYLVRGQTQTAYQLGEQLLRLAEAQPDPTILLLAHSMQGMVLFMRGEPALAQTHHTQALAIYTPQAHRDLALRNGSDIGVSSHSFMGWELWQLGYPDQALQHCKKALRLAQEVSHPYSLAYALIWMTVVHQFRRGIPATQEHSESTIGVSTEHGFAQWLARGTVLHGWSLAMQGQNETGIAEMRRGLAAELDRGLKGIQPYFLALLAEAFGEGGSPEEGLPLLAEALAVMDTTEGRFYEAGLYHTDGRLRLKLATPDASRAETCFHQALDIARHQQAKSFELRVATSLARLWQSQGKRQAAYDLLAPVYGWFTEGFDTADLKDARALLEELKT